MSQYFLPTWCHTTPPTNNNTAVRCSNRIPLSCRCCCGKWGHNRVQHRVHVLWARGTAGWMNAQVPPHLHGVGGRDLGLDQTGVVGDVSVVLLNETVVMRAEGVGGERLGGLGRRGRRHRCDILSGAISHDGHELNVGQPPVEDLQRPDVRLGVLATVITPVVSGRERANVARTREWGITGGHAAGQQHEASA